MHERYEISSLLSFDNLTPRNKIRAVLAALSEPVTKELALNISGVSKNESSIEDLFEDRTIVTIRFPNERLFQLSMDERARFQKNVDMRSVNRRILQYYISRIKSFT